MGAFTLASEQTEHLDRPVAEAAEPVRHPRVELDRLAGGQDEVLIAEHQPEPAAPDRSAMLDGEPVTLTDSVLRAARRP